MCKVANFDENYYLIFPLYGSYSDHLSVLYTDLYRVIL